MRAPLVSSKLQIQRVLLSELPARLRSAQPLFEATGGLHAAGLFDAAGRLECAREDIGRHNAVDKLVGWALDTGSLPLGERLLVVSGRIGYEKSYKRPSPPACRSSPRSVPPRRWRSISAEQFGVTLAGFVRDGSMNVYTHPERITY